MDSGLFILKAGSTFPELARKHGDFDSWIRRHLGAIEMGVHLLAPDFQQGYPAAERVAGLIISGSHGMLTDKPGWVPEAARWIRTLVERKIPVLGICYGHQLLAQAFGGKVDFLEGGPEYGMTRIHCNREVRDDLLLEGLGDQFPAYVAHSQTVRELPSDAVPLGSSERDPHQAFRLGSAWGVQFHPEFSAEIMNFYMNRWKDQVNPVTSMVVNSEGGRSALVLRNFSRVTEGKRASGTS